LVYFAVIWYTFPLFGIFYQEKSGNPAATKGCTANEIFFGSVTLQNDGIGQKCVGIAKVKVVAENNIPDARLT
jgi:hypothetical protein